MGIKKHYKKRFPKKIVSKSFCKAVDKNPKPIFSRFVLRFTTFVTFLGVSPRFFGEGGSRTPLKGIYTPKKNGPGHFLASDPPTHHGGRRFLSFLAAP
jgi:hypothetical protein